MKAVVLDETRQLQLVDRPVPEPRSGEVLVRSEYCGICGTDLHAPELEIFATPVVMGHEFAGVLAAVGPDVTGWKEGDRVAVNPNANVCGTCEHCRAGRNNLCNAAINVNSLGVRRDGGMAEYVSIPAVHLVALPEEVDTFRGAWTEPLAVAVRAVRNSGLRLGDSTAVIGGGPVGLLVLQLIRRAGATRTMLVEPSEFRRAAAITLGADEAISPQDLSGTLASGDFRLVDRVFECSGHPTAMQTSIDMVAPGGTIRLIGASPKPLAFTALDALYKEINLSANFIYVGEFAQAIELLSRDLVDVQSLISTIVPLDDYESAFTALRQPESTIKAFIRTGEAA